MLNIYISKSDSTLQVDWDKMPDNAKQHIIEYGLRQKLNDAGSSATVKALGEEAAPQALAMAENVLAALMEGKITVRSAGVALTDAERMFNKILKALHKKTVGKVDEDASLSAVLDNVAKALNKPVDEVKAAIEKKAQVELEIAKKVATLKAQSPDIEL